MSRAAQARATAGGDRRRRPQRLLERALEFDYARPNDKPDCRWREKAERERMLTRVAEDAERRCRRSSELTSCSRTRWSLRRIGCCAS